MGLAGSPLLRPLVKICSSKMTRLWKCLDSFNEPQCVRYCTERKTLSVILMSASIICSLWLKQFMKVTIKQDIWSLLDIFTWTRCLHTEKHKYQCLMEAHVESVSTNKSFSLCAPPLSLPPLQFALFQNKSFRRHALWIQLTEFKMFMVFMVT